MFQSIDGLDERHIVDVSITQLFRLKAGAKDAKCQEDQIILREFLHGPVANESSRKEVGSVLCCYPISSYKDEINHFRLLYECHNRPNVLNKYLEDEQFDEIVYQREYLSRAPGCAHRVSGAELLCPACNEFYGCRYCHDEAELDHLMDMDAVVNVRCRYCANIEPFALQCSNCKVMFGTQEMLCIPCKRLDYIGPDVRPSIHCDKCKRCNCALPGEMKHCDTCNTCYNVRNTKIHLCGAERACPVCLEDIGPRMAATVTLSCGHILHSECRDGMMRKGMYTCPICFKTLLLDDEISEYDTHFLRLYAYLAIIEPHQELTTRKCRQCGHVFMDVINAAALYECTECMQWNSQECTEKADYSLEEIIAMQIRGEAELAKNYIQAFYGKLDPEPAIDSSGITSAQIVAFVPCQGFERLCTLPFKQFLTEVKETEICEDVQLERIDE